jgi:hypothetical protein
MPETTKAENPPTVAAKAPTKGSLKAGLTSMVFEKASRNERLRADWISMGPEKMMAFLKARWKSKVSLKAPTKAGPKEAANLLIGFEKVQKMAEPTEAESPPMVAAKAQTKGSLKAGLTSKVTVKASRNERLKVDWISMGPAKTMASLKARWKSKEAEKASTKAGPKEARSLSRWYEKVQTMPATTEAENPPMVAARVRTKGSLKGGLTSTVSRKASRNERPTADWISMGPGKKMAYQKARWKSKVSLKASTKAGPKEARSLPI